MSRSEIKFSVLSLLLLFIGATKAALYDSCDQVRNINAGTPYDLKSPNYPNNYAPSSSCRYKFIAPLDHIIKIVCTMNMNAISNAQCSTEFMYTSRDGDLLFRDRALWCGTGPFTTYSVFRSMVVAYESRGSWGKFRCQVTAQPEQCDCGWNVNTKIMGGIEANINEFPSIVALRDTSFSTTAPPFCQGTILTHRFILTTTACARYQPNASKVMALVGQHDLAVPNRFSAQYGIQQFIEYPNYSNNPVHNDIAIARTVAAIDWSRGVGPVCLPPTGFSFDFVNQDVIIAGWGSQVFAGPTVDKLQKVAVAVKTNAMCQVFYSITPAQMCTSSANKDACQFDSGGPNYYYFGARQYVVGIISYGSGCGSRPSVNTRLSYYLWWIQETIGYSACSRPI